MLVSRINCQDRETEYFGLERTSESNMLSLLKEGPTWKLKPILKLDQVADL